MWAIPGVAERILDSYLTKLTSTYRQLPTPFVLDTPFAPERTRSKDIVLSDITRRCNNAEKEDFAGCSLQFDNVGQTIVPGSSAFVLCSDTTADPGRLGVLVYK